MLLNRRKFGRMFSGLLMCGLLAIIGCQDQGAVAPGGGDKGGDVSGKAAGQTRRIILLTNGDSPFWDAGRAGLNDAKTELKLAEAGLDAIMEVNDGTIAGQLTKLRQFASQSDIAGVGISAIDAKNVNVADELRKLKEKGVFIVTFDSDMDRTLFRDVRSAFIGTDNFLGGKELGVCARQLLPEGGEYVTFVGLSSAQNARERIDGFAEGAGEKLKSADAMADDFDRPRARENVRNAIRNHPGVKALVGIYSYNAPAIVDVVKELGKREALKIVAFDAEPIAIQQISEGQIDALVVQDPYQMGYSSVKLLKALITKDEATQKEMLPKQGEEGGDIIDTGLKVVVPDADSPIKKEAFGEKTKFLTLPEFKEWLAKYNLVGS